MLWHLKLAYQRDLQRDRRPDPPEMGFPWHRSSLRAHLVDVDRGNLSTLNLLILNRHSSANSVDVDTGDL
jgi:hypothetical protein